MDKQDLNNSKIEDQIQSSASGFNMSLMEMPSTSQGDENNLKTDQGQPTSALTMGLVELASSSQEQNNIKTKQSQLASSSNIGLVELPSTSQQNQNSMKIEESHHASTSYMGPVELPSTSQQDQNSMKIEESHHASTSYMGLVELPSTSQQDQNSVKIEESHHASTLYMELVELPSTSQDQINIKIEESHHASVSDMGIMDLPSTSKQDQNIQQNQAAGYTVPAEQSTSQCAAVLNIQRHLQNIHINGSEKDQHYQYATWQGVIEWLPRKTLPSSHPAVAKPAAFQALTLSKPGEPVLWMRIDAWPLKLKMILIPMSLIKIVCKKYSQNYKTLFFYPLQCETLETLAHHMKSGYVGYVHFPLTSLKPCDVKVMLLFYLGKERAYLGFMPRNQSAFRQQFIETIREVHANPDPLTLGRLCKEPKPLLESASYSLGAMIANFALDVLKECETSAGNVYAEENRRYPNLLVASAAEFLDDFIPRHLHDIVTQHSLACIRSLPNDFQNDYNILDIFLRSDITEFNFFSEIHKFF